MAELKPCPFCGRKAIPIILKYGDGTTYHGTTCEDWRCPVSSIVPSYSSEKEATEAWNRRTAEPGEIEFDHGAED